MAPPKLPHDALGLAEVPISCMNPDAVVWRDWPEPESSLSPSRLQFPLPCATKPDWPSPVLPPSDLVSFKTILVAQRSPNIGAR